MGTSHLKKHLSGCPTRKNSQQGLQNLSINRNINESAITTYKFDLGKSRLDRLEWLLNITYSFNMC